MDYYGFVLGGAYAERPHADAVGDVLRLARRADELGIDGWYLTEHHGQPSFSLTSAPNMVATAIAMQTTRLRVGTMVTILPFSNPLRVAEEFRTLDLLSGGRLEVGFGRGQVRHEQAAFGIERDRTVEMFDVSYDIVTRLLRGETVDFDTPWWTGKGAVAMPEPTQLPVPPLWMSAGSEASVEKCATLGLNCATNLLTRAFADERLALYRKWWDQHQPGRPGEGKFAVSAHVAVADTERAAYEHFRKDFEQKQAHFAQSVTDRPGDDDATYRGHMPAYNAFVASTLETMLDDGLLIAGTVGQCREQLARIKARGFDRLLCTFHTGDANFDFSMRSMEMFATEVVPYVEAAES
ncbi:MAG TPA: LLM class flavin-dependent oxidoreductase [Trebonia sp.]|jgi:alkanesulfonate monooxygenase SsuD/methylene tetrahydromethanopterin reductase-like flavin-dependent oxidoreductase (luciferase family)